MKITCERDVLSNALAIVSKAVSGRNTLPILSNILFEAKTDRVELTATDLDTAIKYVIAARVERDGSVAIPASILSDIVSKLPDAPLS